MNVKVIIIIVLGLLLCMHPHAMAQEKKQIEVQCGEYKVAITCGHTSTYPEDSRYCNNNTLTFTWPNGKVVTPKTPKNFDDSKTPMGMECGRGKDGRFYLIIEFNNGPQGCAPCLDYDLFEDNGNRITVNMKNLDKTVEKRGIKFSKKNRIEWDNPLSRKLHKGGKI